MADPKMYRRVKKLSFSQLKTVKTGESERMIPSNNPFEALFVIVIAADLAKNLYFSYHSIDLNTRLLFGDITISSGQDQRLFNLNLCVAYVFIILHFYFGRFSGQKIRFYKLSQFLLVLDHDEYARRFLVTKEFVLKFAKEMDFFSAICPFLVNGYILVLNSYYLTSLYQAISLGFDLQLVLGLTCPSMLNGALALTISVTISIQSFMFYMLYTKLVGARVSRLVMELRQLSAKSGKKRLLSHLRHVNSVVVDWELSKRYFEKSVGSFIPVVLSSAAFFPSIVIVSRQLFTNRLTAFYVFNVFGLWLPIVLMNEHVKRQFALYVNAVHWFVSTSKWPESKLKLTKILEIVQPEGVLSYTMFDGAFHLNTLAVQKVLIETVAVTFLLYVLVN